MIEKGMTPEEALAHFGVKGMKWGVRKRDGKSNPGVARRGARKLATYQTNRQINAHKDALSGKGLVGVAALADKYTWGRNGRFEGYHNKKISELERSKERIAKGELTTRTLLFGPQYSKADGRTKSASSERTLGQGIEATAQRIAVQNQLNRMQKARAAR